MIKTILVPICHDPGADQRIDFAIELALKHHAHIQALHVLTPAREMFKVVPVQTYSAEIFDQYEKNLLLEAKAYRDKYEKKLNASGVRYDWCQSQGDLVTTLNHYSRTADITILTQKESSIYDIMSIMHDFIIESGMPVIVIPSAEVKADFQNILIAWDGGQHCAKAVHNALPLLKEAKTVTVLTITQDDKTTIPEADICVKLVRHGINAEALTLNDSVKVETRILKTAQSLEADLIIAGAWGHRRIREIIFGGVTKTLLSNQKYPLFLSH